jgi:hypothetical protein
VTLTIIMALPGLSMRSQAVSTGDMRSFRGTAGCCCFYTGHQGLVASVIVAGRILAKVPTLPR